MFVLQLRYQKCLDVHYRQSPAAKSQDAASHKVSHSPHLHRVVSVSSLLLFPRMTTCRHFVACCCAQCYVVRRLQPEARVTEDTRLGSTLASFRDGVRASVSNVVTLLRKKRSANVNSS